MLFGIEWKEKRERKTARDWVGEEHSFKKSITWRVKYSQEQQSFQTTLGWNQRNSLQEKKRRGSRFSFSKNFSLFLLSSSLSLFLLSLWSRSSSFTRSLHSSRFCSKDRLILEVILEEETSKRGQQSEGEETTGEKWEVRREKRRDQSQQRETETVFICFPFGHHRHHDSVYIDGNITCILSHLQVSWRSLRLSYQMESKCFIWSTTTE